MQIVVEQRDCFSQMLYGLDQRIFIVAIALEFPWKVDNE